MFRRKRSHEPGGVVAIPIEQLDEWALNVVNAASDKSCSGATPEPIDVLAKVTLPDVCGRDRATTMAPSAGLLAYNLFLLGYWSRDEELRVQGQMDQRPYLEVWMEGAREHLETTWFETIQWAAHTLADDPEVRGRLAEFIAPGAGDDFRSRLALVGIARMADVIEGQHPGTSALVTPPEKVRCWTLGYWTHATSKALSPDAQAALAAEGA